MKLCWSSLIQWRVRSDCLNWKDRLLRFLIFPLVFRVWPRGRNLDWIGGNLFFRGFGIEIYILLIVVDIGGLHMGIWRNWSIFCRKALRSRRWICMMRWRVVWSRSCMSLSKLMPLRMLWRGKGRLGTQFWGGCLEKGLRILWRDTQR